MNRRKFIKSSGTAVAAAMTVSPVSAQSAKRPNIIVIVTDQQSATMMSSAGNSYLKTPNMDRLAASGVSFERAYCSAPVCVPSRFSLMTGRMPSEIGMRSNELDGVIDIPKHILDQGLGQRFKRAGYDAAYGGKEHLPKMDVNDLGFDYICEDERDELAATCADYIKEERDKPFLLISSLINPHDICYMAIRDFAESEFSKYLIKAGVVEVKTLDRALKTPDAVSREEFLRDYCPPLPANFEPQQDEPDALRDLIALRPFRMKARKQWTDERWRMHRWAYHRLTEMVDTQVGIILDALDESGKAEETVVIFTSDHGDMDASHRMEHKTAFYDEASRIPLIVSQPGKTPSGIVDRSNLVSNGLDLYPTLCDYAGIELPHDLHGMSFRPLAEGLLPAHSRKAIPVENEIGRMIVSAGHKYAQHDGGENSEQLYDLAADPGEMRNAMKDNGKKDVVQDHRTMFVELFGGK